MFTCQNEDDRDEFPMASMISQQTYKQSYLSPGQHIDIPVGNKYMNLMVKHRNVYPVNMRSHIESLLVATIPKSDIVLIIDKIWKRI